MKTSDKTLKELIYKICELINIPEETKLKKLADELDNKTNKFYKLDPDAVTDENERQMYLFILASRNIKSLTNGFFNYNAISEKEYIYEITLTLEAVLKN